MTTVQQDFESELKEEFARNAAAPKATQGTFISSVEEIDVAWLWPEVIPLKYVTFLIGDPGIGKSTLRDDLIARITTDRCMPNGSFGDTTGGVVLVTPEDDIASIVKRRLRIAGADDSKVLDLSMVDRNMERYGEAIHDRFMLPDDIAILEQAAHDSQAALIVLDPLMGILNPKVSGARNQTARMVVSKLEAVAKRTGAAILIIGHNTKSAAKERRIRMGGSGGFYENARSVLFLERNPDNAKQTILTLDKHNMSEDGIPQIVCFKGEDGRLAYIQGIDQEQQEVNAIHLLITTRERILDLLNGQPDRDFTIPEVSYAIGVEYDAASQVMRRMVKRGEIVQAMRGRYHAARSEAEPLLRVV